MGVKLIFFSTPLNDTPQYYSDCIRLTEPTKGCPKAKNGGKIVENFEIPVIYYDYDILSI